MIKANNETRRSGDTPFASRLLRRAGLLEGPHRSSKSLAILVRLIFCAVILCGITFDLNCALRPVCCLSSVGYDNADVHPGDCSAVPPKRDLQGFYCSERKERPSSGVAVAGEPTALRKHFICCLPNLHAAV